MQTKKSQSSSGAASLLITLAILLSRISGLARDKAIAYYLGNSMAAGAFRAALRIPNFLQNLFGEGVLSASFIPVYTRLRAHGENELARAVAGAVGGLLMLGTSLIVALGVVFTPALVDLLAPGFEDTARDLTIEIVRILFPGVGLLVLSAWCLGILNSHRKFFLSYVASVFWNLALIVTLIAVGTRRSEEDLVIALAWASVVGSFLQFASQLPFVYRNAGRIRPSLALGLQATREVLKNFVPVFIGRGVVQLSAFIDGMIASFLGPQAVASIAYAQTLYLLPISLFGMAVAAAELPEMSERAASGASDEVSAQLKARIVAGSRRIAFFVVPSMCALIVLGKFLITLIYKGGKFTSADTLFVWYILMASAIGLVAATWGRLHSSVFYALGDTRTPLKIALLRIAVSLTLGLILAFPARDHVTAFVTSIMGRPELEGIDLGMGAVGLTLASAIAGWIELSFLKRGLERRLGKIDLPYGYTGKTLALGSVAALIAWQVPSAADLGHDISGSVMAIVVFGALYLGGGWVLGLDELKALRRRLRI